MDTEQPPKKTIAPWIATAASLIIGGVSIYQFITMRIRVTNSDVTKKVYYIEYSERPMDFIIIQSLMILVALGAGFYAFKKFKRESESDA